MLSQLSEEREITGIDYDEDKIALAQQGWLRTPHLQFVCANALEYPLPESDVFILNDMLHYMSYEHQQTLLLRCMERLRPEGKLIMRTAMPPTHPETPSNPFHGTAVYRHFQFQPDNRTTVFHIRSANKEYRRSMWNGWKFYLMTDIPRIRFISSKKTNRNMSKYDIIIIGSGLGGLECGAILSKEGFNVCVLKKMRNCLADASRLTNEEGI